MSTQTDPNAAYNAMVRQIAELLIRHDATCGIWDQMSESARKDAVSYFKPMARAMVSVMENEAKEAYFQCAQDHGGFANYSDPDLKQHLIERGLIPAKPEDNAR